MSSGYTVVVPHERWPSNAAMQASLDARGYPVALVGGATDAPFAAATRGGIELRLDGHLHTLAQASAMPVTGAEFTADETNATLAEIGAEFRAREGDWHFGVGLGSDPRDWRGAFLIMAALVRDFGGYGYETQAESHGRDAWADELVEAAEQFRLQAAATAPTAAIAAASRPAQAPPASAKPAAASGPVQVKFAGVVCLVLGALCVWTAIAGGNVFLTLIGGLMFAMGVAVFFIRRRIA